MIIRLFVRFLAGIFILPCLAEEKDVSKADLEILLAQLALWEVSATDLQQDFETLQFQWTSAAQDSARSIHPGLELRGRRVYEALARFQAAKPREFILIYFNRGDADSLRRDLFEKLIADVSQDLSALTGKAPTPRGRNPGSAVKAEGSLWETDSSRYLLEWSATKESRAKMIPFRAEFLRLTITPLAASPQTAFATPQPSTRNIVKQFVGRDHIERSPNGDVKLRDVPMVDQGDKGYCVVASVERVMRYYGAPVDQHELAQIADSDADKGTSIEAMVASLKKLTARLGVRIRPIYDWNIQDFLKIMEDYNRATKRGKLAEEVRLEGQIIDADACFQQIKPALFKEVRLKKQADFGKFQREVQRSIDEGIPLLWAVHLGLVSEKEIPQSFGGHMRLIIGYNPSAKEILYSDSWGRGHEEKRMAFDDAWAMTMGLASLRPLGS